MDDQIFNPLTENSPFIYSYIYLLNIFDLLFCATHPAGHFFFINLSVVT